MRDRETLVICGAEFVLDSALTFGDYGGAGSVGLANIRVVLADSACSLADGSGIYDAADTASRYYSDAERDLLRQSVSSGANAIHEYGSHFSQSVWLRSDSDFGRETLASLESYPLLNGDEESTVESEWLDEAWESWLRSELLGKAFPHSRVEDDDSADDLRDSVESLDDGILFQNFQIAMEECNVYPTPEYSGVHVDVERIADTFRVEIRKLLPVEAS